MLQQISIFEKYQNTLPFMASPFTFSSFIEENIKYYENLTRDSIKQILENSDLEFRNSKDRKRRYYIKYIRPRTITTMAGIITYTRTIYTDRTTNKTYCYVDSKFGIRKHVKYTDDVGSEAFLKAASSNSMIKVGNDLGKEIHTKYTIEDDSIFAIPRQTIYNLLKRVKEINILDDNIKKQVKDLYILLDEKYIGNQNPKSPKIMAKCALILEGLDSSNKRHKYINKHYFTRVSDNYGEQLIDYITRLYDISYLKHIHVLADGGLWIKQVINDDIKPLGIKTTFYLDHFHFSNSLWTMTQNKKIYDLILNYIANGMFDDARKVLNTFKEKSPDKVKYFLNNKTSIKNMLNLKNMNCAAEQMISHHVASIFTSVPKAYSIENINRYLSTRDNLRNGENLKKIYLLGVYYNNDDSPITYINKTPIEITTKLNDNEIYKQGAEYRYVHYSLSYNHEF